MKKILAIFASFAALTPISAFAVSADQSIAYKSEAPTYQITLECATATDQFKLFAFSPDNSVSASTPSGKDCDQFPDYLFTDVSGNGMFYYEQIETIVGSYKIIEAGLNADCSTLENCRNDPDFVNEISVSLATSPNALMSLSNDIVPQFTATLSDTLGANKGIMVYSIVLVSLFWILSSIIGVFKDKNQLKYDERAYKRRGGRRRKQELLDYAREDVNFVRGFGEIGKE